MIFWAGKKDEFLSTISISTRDPEEMREWTRSRCAEGFRGLEVHLGDKPGSGIDNDIARVKAVREEAGDEVAIVGDVHRNWTVKETIQAAEVLASFNLVIEQPCRGIHQLALARSQSKLPVGADEDCHTVQNTVDLIRADAVDFVTIKPMKAGGLTKAKKIADLAESFGILVRVDGIPGETILSNGASAHLIMTLENTVTCGVMQNIRLSEDLVTKGGMKFENGLVSLTANPGLGVEEINEDLLNPVAVII